MIHAVLQWQVKKKPIPALRNTGAPLGKTSNEAGVETGSPGRAGTESGALPAEIGIEGEALPSEAGAKARAPRSQARAKIGATVSNQVLPSCDDDDDAGEGPSSLIRETAIPKQDENKEDKLDEEQTRKFKRELGGRIAHPRRPLLDWF